MEAIPLRKQIAMGKKPQVSTGGKSPGLKKGGSVRTTGNSKKGNC